MNATTTIPTIVHTRRNLTIGLVAVAVALTAALVWAVVGYAIDSTGVDDPAGGSSVPASAHAVARLSPEQLAATYGYIFGPAHEIAAMSQDQLAATYGNVFAPPVDDRVEAIAAMSPEALAATYGNVFDPAPSHGEAVAELSPEQLAGAYGNVLSDG